MNKKPSRVPLAGTMGALTLALWQLRQTWRLLLIVGVGIIAAAMLVCVVPLYTQVTTTAGLRSVLNASKRRSTRMR